MLLASRTGSLLNLADLSRSLELPYTTLKRYLALLEAVFLVVMLPPWSSNIGKRLVKSHKVFLNDTGISCHLLHTSSEDLDRNRTLLGSIFENLIVMELLKQIAWSEIRPKMFHFRTIKGHEVDIVLQRRNGKLVGIECKASSTISMDHFKGLAALKELVGEKFHRGIVLYTGSETVSFANDFEAVPVSALWEISSKAAPALTE